MKFLAFAAALLIAGVASAEQYKVITPLSNDDDGAMAFLMNYDTGERVDSVLVADGVATFQGQVDEPFLAIVTVDRNAQPMFILEPGTISFNATEGAFGTMLNDELRNLNRKISEIKGQYKTADPDTQQRLIASFEAMLDSTMNANSDNPIGYYIFINGSAPQASAADLREMFKKYPEFAKGARAKRMLATAEKSEATRPGKKYVDFAVTYNGKTERLSDYVKPGKYTLVDFWASWCGPCMRQAAVLKDLYAKYHDKGLDIVGVAVWDQPENTLAAIKSHGLVWPNILDAQTIPTDLYGISGIPCIILIGPDGTILSRDKQGEELVADVEKYVK